jgi:site-specific DNA recombinase
VGPLAGAVEPLWEELFPAEQARIIQLLAEQVDVYQGGLDTRLRIEGLTRPLKDLTAAVPERRAA